MKYLTVGQIRKGCKNYKYVLLSNANESMAVNVKVMKLAATKVSNNSDKSRWFSFREISFEEYIQRKVPFL